MPNTNMPRGLVPLRNAGSTHESGGVEMFAVAAADATALYIGDPVIKDGGADAGGLATVTRASGTGAITGVVEGFMPNGTTDMVGHRAASTAAYVLVRTDPDTLYEVQSDTALTAANIGLNANLTAAAGNANSKRSGFTLAAASLAVTATLPVKVVGLSQRAGNEFGANNKVVVKINNSTEANATAGI